MPFFQSNGYIPFARQSLNMSSKDLCNEFPHICNIWMLTLSGPWALFGLRLWIIFNISVFTSFTVDKRLSVRKWSRRGNLLSFLIMEYCFAKNELKSLAFSIKSGINLLLWNNGGIAGILWLFRKTFNRPQYALVLFWIVFNFCVNLKKHFCFELSIRSCNRCCKELKFLRNWLLITYIFAISFVNSAFFIN